MREAAIRRGDNAEQTQRRSSKTIPFQQISPLWEPEQDVRSRHQPLTTPSVTQRRSSRNFPLQRTSPSWEPELDVRSRHPPR